MAAIVHVLRRRIKGHLRLPVQALTAHGRVAPAMRMTSVPNTLRIQRAAFKEYNCRLVHPVAAGYAGPEELH
jgi:hypothetical protein